MLRSVFLVCADCAHSCTCQQSSCRNLTLTASQGDGGVGCWMCGAESGTLCDALILSHTFSLFLTHHSQTSRSWSTTARLSWQPSTQHCRCAAFHYITFCVRTSVCLRVHNYNLLACCTCLDKPQGSTGGGVLFGRRVQVPVLGKHAHVCST